MTLYGSTYPQPLKYILTRQKAAQVKSMLKAIGWENKTAKDVSNRSFRP